MTPPSKLALKKLQLKANKQKKVDLAMDEDGKEDTITSRYHRSQKRNQYERSPPPSPPTIIEKGKRKGSPLERCRGIPIPITTAYRDDLHHSTEPGYNYINPFVPTGTTTNSPSSSLMPTHPRSPTLPFPSLEWPKAEHIKTDTQSFYQPKRQQHNTRPEKPA